MKHIKLMESHYIQLFEGFFKKKTSKKKITLEEIRDCFADLEDNNRYNVVIKEGDNNVFVVYIGKPHNDRWWYATTTVDELKEVLLFAIPYMKETYDVVIKYSGVHYDCGF
jgi:hypothetical protein